MSILCALFLAGAAFAARANPTQDLLRARAEFERGEYLRTVEILEPQLFPEVKISDPDELLDAYLLVGVSHYFLEQREEARRAFQALLSQDPDYELDAVLYPPDLVGFFNAIKSEQKELLDELRKAREKERRLEEERRRLGRTIVIEREYYDPKPGLNWVPFGVGQFKNGQPGKGRFFLVAEGALAGVSVGIATYLWLRYGPGLPLDRPEPDDVDLVQSLQVVQIGTGGLFLLVYAWGVVDAYANQKPRVLEKPPRMLAPDEEVPGLSPEPPPPAARSRLQLTPFFTRDAAGLGVVGEF